MCKRIREDIAAVRQRDPAARSGFEILLMYAGVHAVLAPTGALAVPAPLLFPGASCQPAHPFFYRYRDPPRRRHRAQCFY